MSHGETHPSGFRMALFFYYGSAALLHSAPFLDSLQDWLGFVALGSHAVSLPGSPVGTVGGTMVIPQGHLCTSVILLPLTSPNLILRSAFYSLEEGGTDMHNMVPDPIVGNLGPFVWVHCITQKVRGVQVMQRALLPKGSMTCAQKAFTAGAKWSLYLSSLQKDMYCNARAYCRTMHAPGGLIPYECHG